MGCCNCRDTSDPLGVAVVVHCWLKEIEVSALSTLPCPQHALLSAEHAWVDVAHHNRGNHASLSHPTPCLCTQQPAVPFHTLIAAESVDVPEQAAGLVSAGSWCCACCSWVGVITPVQPHAGIGPALQHPHHAVLPPNLQNSTPVCFMYCTPAFTGSQP
jgi:hypothetical protein